MLLPEKHSRRENIIIKKDKVTSYCNESHKKTLNGHTQQGVTVRKNMQFI